MPFQPVPLGNARCPFTGSDCRKNCAAATPHPDDSERWLCRWMQTMELMQKVMQVLLLQSNIPALVVTSDDKAKKK